MSNTHPFRPLPDATATLSATNASSRAALISKSVSNCSVRIYNAGSAAVFVKFGSSTVAATTDNDFPIPSGGIEVFETRDDETHVAVITAASTATVYATTGDGL